MWGWKGVGCRVWGYISNRLPDKTTDLMDEATTQVCGICEGCGGSVSKKGREVRFQPRRPTSWFRALQGAPGALQGRSVRDEGLLAALLNRIVFILSCSYQFLFHGATIVLLFLSSQVKMEQTLKPEALDAVERKIRQLEMEEASLKPKVWGGWEVCGVNCVGRAPPGPLPSFPCLPAMKSLG